MLNRASMSAVWGLFSATLGVVLDAMGLQWRQSLNSGNPISCNAKQQQPERRALVGQVAILSDRIMFEVWPHHDSNYGGAAPS